MCALHQTVGAAQPRFLRGGESGVLLVHGFASYPGIMDYLAERLHADGHTVSVPRLPGCGTSGIDFTTVRARDWYRRVYDAYQDLNGICREVCVAGISLGGLLTIRLAAHAGPDRIALLAPAVKNTNRMILFTPFIRWCLRRVPGRFEARGQDMDDPDVQFLAKEYWSWRWSSASAEVLRLQRQARRVLRKVISPTLLIMSKNDRTVPLSAAELIEHKIGANNLRFVTLNESSHTLVADSERETVADLVCDWFGAVHHEEEEGCSAT